MYGHGSSGWSVFSLGYSLDPLYLDTTNDRVGINTTAPDATFEINMSTAGHFRMSYNDGDGSATDYAKFEIAADGLLTLTTVDADAAEADIALMPDGMVGIGTAAPASKLHIESNVQGLFEVNNSTASGFAQCKVEVGGTAQLYFYGFGASYAGVGAFEGDGGAVTAANGEGLSLGATNANGEIKFYTAGTAVVNERMRIDNAGLVGIGTASPAEELDVQGDIISGQTTNGDANDINNYMTIKIYCDSTITGETTLTSV
ncbi:MAG: hypothetical protein GY869_01145, partial [Planctomycetes bacterium]|nr:hypothetical protein [Planctomycetota bacterium]